MISICILLRVNISKIKNKKKLFFSMLSSLKRKEKNKKSFLCF